MHEWLDDAVFYEIYPQSFMDTNGDGIGDFKGIEEKLDYVKDLGCDAIWINPCFDSPFLDAGYDVRDYYRTADRYGTNEELKELIDTAHEKGLKVLLDLVPGHTSSAHPWFRESCRAQKNEMTDRYVWTDSVWEAPEGMNCIRGISERDGSAIVNFFSHQPALNYGFYHPDPDHPWQQAMDAPGPMATREEMKKVMAYWLDLGADGFRVDMAGSLVKNDPEAKGTIALWQDIRSFLDQNYPEAVFISEWGEPDKSLEAGFHMDFLLHFGPSHYNDLFRCEHPYFAPEGQGSIQAFLEKYLDNLNRTKGEGLICIPSGNHDMVRLATGIGEDALPLAFAFLLSMPGAPFIYYGDEIGMRYVEGLPSKEGGYFRTGSRTPMQWDDTKNAGFSQAEAEELYLPIDPDENRSNAADQMEDSDSLYSLVKDLIQIRKAHPALQGRASFTPVEHDGEYPLAYIRESEDGEKVLVVINPSSQAVTLPGDFEITDCLFRTGEAIEAADGVLRIPGTSAAWYKIS